MAALLTLKTWKKYVPVIMVHSSCFLVVAMVIILGMAPVDGLRLMELITPPFTVDMCCWYRWKKRLVSLCINSVAGRLGGGWKQSAGVLLQGFPPVVMIYRLNPIVPRGGGGFKSAHASEKLRSLLGNFGSQRN